MKVTQILAASIAVLFTGHMAWADVTIRITGSTAFRSATTNAIKNILSSGNPTIAYTLDGSATNFTNGSYQTFAGTYPGITGTVTVKTSWTGSSAGIRDLSAGNTIVFLPNGTVGSTGAGTVATTPTAAEGVPDITMEDSAQTSTPFTSPAIDKTFAIGIIPFAWVANANATELTNMTQQHGSALLSNGSQPVSLFTGDATQTKRVYAVGRDPFSGTRVITLAELQYGTQTLVRQFAGTANVSNSLTNLDIYPASTEVPDIGNGGESSGGKVANLVRYQSTSVSINSATATSVGVVGYMGENDTYNAVYGISAGVTGGNSANAHYLTYNGVAGFGGVATKPTNINTHLNTKILDGITPNLPGGIIAGQIVFGKNIAPGSVVVSVDSATQITVDKNSLADGATTNGQIGALLPAAIRNGSYTFWNYESIAWKSGTAGTGVVGNSGDKFTFATGLRDDIKTTDYAFGGLGLDSAVKVSRDQDGGYVHP